MPTMVIIISRGKTVRFINTIKKLFTTGIKQFFHGENHNQELF